MKKLNRVIAILLAIVLSFLCFSEAAFAVDNTTAANTRTSTMFKFFRDDRTTLDTTSVSPDELAVFGVFLSNFMIPGKTKLSEFFKADSEINNTVSQIFFGADNTKVGTIGNLTKMLGDAITNEEGLGPVQIIKDGSLETLTMYKLVNYMTKNSIQKDIANEIVYDEKEDLLYYGSKPILNMKSIDFRLALAEVLAVSLTEAQAEKEVANSKWLGKLVDVENNVKEIGGILQWLTLEKFKDNDIKIDCIGNFWLKTEGNDYTLFIPACLQSFVMSRDNWHTIQFGKSKIPLVNSFYMGCMLNLDNVSSSKSSFQTFVNILSNANADKHKQNAINMCVIESPFLSINEDILEKTDAQYEMNEFSNDKLMKSQQNNYTDVEKHLLIDASWSNFFYNAKEPSNEESNYCQLFNYIVKKAKDSDNTLVYSQESVRNFLNYFCFIETVKLSDCITDMYYFNTEQTGSQGGIKWKGDDDLFESIDKTVDKNANNNIFKETLFESATSSKEESKYNAVVSSSFNDYLIAVNTILTTNSEGEGIRGKVDWSKMAQLGEYDSIIDNLHVPKCDIVEMLKSFKETKTSSPSGIKYQYDNNINNIEGSNLESELNDACIDRGFTYLFQHIYDGTSPIELGADTGIYLEEFDWDNPIVVSSHETSTIYDTNYDKDKNPTAIKSVKKGWYLRKAFVDTKDINNNGDRNEIITIPNFAEWVNTNLPSDSPLRNLVDDDGNVYYCVNITNITFEVDNSGVLRPRLKGECIPIANKIEVEPKTLLKPYKEESNNSSEQGNDCGCAFHKILYTYYRYNWRNLGTSGFDGFKKYLNADGNELLAPAIILYSITGNIRLLDSDNNNAAKRFKELGEKILELYTPSGNSSLSFVKDNWGFLDSGNNSYLEDCMTSSYNLGTGQTNGNKNNIVVDFLYGINNAENGNKVFSTFCSSNVKTTFIATPDNNTIIPVSVYSLTPLGSILVETAYFWFFSITSTEGYKIGKWNFKKTAGYLFNVNGTRGTFEGISNDIRGNNAAFIGGLNVMLQSMYNYRIASIRPSLAGALTANTNYYNCENGQFVANQCNLWPGIYWSYMRSMLFKYKDPTHLELSSYDNPCLPRMNAATKGGGLQLSDLTSRETGLEPIEEMTMEQKQEDLINKALLILSTETSEYRDNWFKSMIDSWLISAHKSVIGTYTNSQLSFNQGVETGSTTYASVTGYVSTPQLTDISITKTIVDNYGVIYVIMIVIVIVYLIALVITGAKGIKESIFVAVILSIVLVFPQILLNNTIGIMNSVVDSMYSDRFNFWAIAKHQSSLNALADAKGKSNAEYVVASNIEMAKQVYSTDQGVRIKWPSPKKIDNFKAIFSDAIDNPNSTVNLTIFKTLFNSFFNQEQYTYDALETYSYRPYNTIANEAKGYFENYISAKDALGDSLALSVAFDAIKDTVYGNSSSDSELYGRASTTSTLTYDNTTYSDSLGENGESYAKVDVSVALACMLNSELNGLLKYDWNTVPSDETQEKGMKPDESDASLKLYYAYSESVFYYFYNVLKSEWTKPENIKSDGNNRLKDAMLEADTFEKKFAKGSKAYIRDFLGLEYLFEYVIPYLNEGNVYVQSYIDKYGMDISRYDFTAGDKITVGTGDDEKTQEELEEYNKAKVQKEEYGQVWLLYSSWVDQLYSACGIEKVGKERFCAINAADYQTYLGRDMVFSELDMQGEYDALSNGYKKVDYTALSSVEQKILKVLKNSYEDIMYLNNYWNYDEEVILTAAAMMATFNFNKEFSNYKVLGDSSVLYPQNFELQNFNYDAFLRLIIMNSTGESLTDTTDLYTRVIGKTSIFTGILLLLTDITAVIGIPALKLVILLILLLIGLAICLTCVTMQIKEVPKKLWICLLKPVLLFAVFTIAFAWVISLFVGTGLTSYVGSSSVSIVTNDPTITFLLLFLVNVIYIIGLVYLFIMLFKIAKREIKGVALAVSGAVAGAALAATTTVTSINKLKNINKIKGGKRKNKKGLEESFEGYENNANSDSIDGNSSGNAINTDGHTELDDSEIASSKNKSSILMNDLNSNEEEEENKANNKHKPEVEESRGTQVVTNETNGENTEKVNKPKESLGSKVATKYMNMAAGVQTGINSVKNSWGKIKTGAFKVKSGVSRVGKAVVDGDTYKSFAYSAITTAGNIKDNVVEKAVGVKDGIVEKAVKVKDTVVDTAKDFQEQFTAANELLAERSEQLANAREKEYEKAINDIIEKNQKMIVERQEKAAKYNEMVMNKKKNKLESSTGIVLAQL